MRLLQLVVLLATAAALIICWRLDMKWIAVAAVAVAAVYLIAFPRFVAGRARAFDREAMTLLTSGKPDTLVALAERQSLLRLFGPSGLLESKQALATAALSRYAEAIPLFEAAIASVPSKESIPLRIGLAKSLMVTGELGPAAKQAKAVLDRGTRLPEVLLVAARSRIGLGRADDETEKLLEEAKNLSPGSDVSLMLELSKIEAAMKQGRKVPTIREGADAEEPFIRSWVALVRGMLRQRRGDAEGAASSFHKAVKTCPEGFAAAEALKHLEASGDAQKITSTKGEMDSVVRRKKRKKRAK